MGSRNYGRVAVVLLAVVLVGSNLALGILYSNAAVALEDANGARNELFTRVQQLSEDIEALRVENQDLMNDSIHIVISRSEQILQLKRGNVILREVPVVVGRGRGFRRFGRTFFFETPTGIFHIQEKVLDPIWTMPDWALIEEGETEPENVPLSERQRRGALGRYALRIGDGYALHGTQNQRVFDLPDGNRNLSHGCIRVPREDLAIIFNSVDTGTAVYIY